jgi:hypothetical protein
MTKEEKRQLRKEKEEKREAAAALRNEAKLKAIEDRLKYYAMIQNDGITKLFHAVASNPDMATKFTGLHGDNTEVRDMNERMNTSGHLELVQEGPKYDLVISVGGIDPLTPRDATQDFSVNPLPEGKARPLKKSGDEVLEDDIESDTIANSGIPVGCGVAMAVRKDGANVREDIEIEHSSIVCR